MTINFVGTKGVTGGMKTAEKNPASTNVRESNTTSTFGRFRPSRTIWVGLRCVSKGLHDSLTSKISVYILLTALQKKKKL